MKEYKRVALGLMLCLMALTAKANGSWMVTGDRALTPHMLNASAACITLERETMDLVVWERSGVCSLGKRTIIVQGQLVEFNSTPVTEDMKAYCVYSPVSREGQDFLNNIFEKVETEGEGDGICTIDSLVSVGNYLFSACGYKKAKSTLSQPVL